jgi:uncharacterized membrane protein YjjP (DUF1212 family)
MSAAIGLLICIVIAINKIRYGLRTIREHSYSYKLNFGRDEVIVRGPATRIYGMLTSLSGVICVAVAIVLIGQGFSDILGIVFWSILLSFFVEFPGGMISKARGDVEKIHLPRGGKISKVN